MLKFGVGGLLTFEDITCILVSHGNVTGPSQCVSTVGEAILMLLGLNVFL